MAKVHYALDVETACKKDVMATWGGETIIQHTCLPDRVTCKHCLRVVQNEEKLAKYKEEIASYGRSFDLFPA